MTISHGAMPGYGTEQETHEAAPFWGPDAQLLQAPLPVLDSTTVDARSTPTTQLQAGLVLGKITASDNYVHYDNAESDGSETAVGILAYALSTLDETGTAVAKRAVIIVKGNVKAAALGGLDAAARTELKAAGFTFDDEV